MRLETVQKIAAPIGTAGAILPTPRKDRVREHLAIAFPEPEYDEAFRRRLLKDSYRALAQFFFETLWIDNYVPERDNERIEISTMERQERTFAMARENGRGLICYAGHLGTPELLARWLVSVTPMPMMAVMGRAGMEGLDVALKAMRERGGVKIVPRGEAGMSTLRHLRAGGCLVMLVDHNLKGPGVEIPFFGKPAHTLLAPARLALQSGAAVNTIFPLRRGPGQFLLEWGEPFLPPAMARDKDERFRQEAAIALEYTRRIEQAIRRTPEQYLWMHRRWRKRDDTLPFPS